MNVYLNRKNLSRVGAPSFRILLPLYSKQINFQICCKKLINVREKSFKNRRRVKSHKMLVEYTAKKHPLNLLVAKNPKVEV